MSNLIVKEFQGFAIRFETREDGKVWSCLNDMAQITGKRLDKYLALDSTKELVSYLGSASIQSKKGRNGGTWAVQEIFLDFAYISSIEFRLWVISAIQDLMTKGFATRQLASESSEDYKKRQQALEEENRLLLTKVGYLEAWSPPMSVAKMRYLEIINYTPDKYSPFLKTTKQLMDSQTMVDEYQMREARMVHDLVDTLLEPGKRVSVYTYHFRDIDSFLEAMPTRFFDTAIKSPHERGRKPKLRENFKQFEKSVRVMHDNCSEIWLEYVSDKQKILESYLQAA